MVETNAKIKPKILVVEDDFENQRFLQLFLKRNFDVSLCDSEESFYEHLKDSSFDLILMDISLKGKKDGLQLTREVKNMANHKNTPIVCLTAHAFQQDKENALNAGVDVFLTKPISNTVLMDTLLEIVKSGSNHSE